MWSRKCHRDISWTSRRHHAALEPAAPFIKHRSGEQFNICPPPHCWCLWLHVLYWGRETASAFNFSRSAVSQAWHQPKHVSCKYVVWDWSQCAQRPFCSLHIVSELSSEWFTDGEDSDRLGDLGGTAATAAAFQLIQILFNVARFQAAPVISTVIQIYNAEQGVFMNLMKRVLHIWLLVTLRVLW